MKIFKVMVMFLIAGVASQWVLAFDYPEEGDFARGSKAWAENCTRCHNMRSPTDLRDDQWITTVFHMRIRAGLTGQEARDILTFLQGSNARIESSKNAKTNPVPVVTNEPDSVSGQRIYESNCMACHGENGQGALPGTPDFTKKGSRMAKSDSELLSNIINGFQSSGAVMAMPPRGGNSKLTDTELFSALKYIREAFAE